MHKSRIISTFSKGADYWKNVVLLQEYSVFQGLSIKKNKTKYIKIHVKSMLKNVMRNGRKMHQNCTTNDSQIHEQVP